MQSKVRFPWFYWARRCECLSSYMPRLGALLCCRPIASCKAGDERSMCCTGEGEGEGEGERKGKQARRQAKKAWYRHPQLTIRGISCHMTTTEATATKTAIDWKDSQFQGVGGWGLLKLREHAGLEGLRRQTYRSSDAGPPIEKCVFLLVPHNHTHAQKKKPARKTAATTATDDPRRPPRPTPRTPAGAPTMRIGTARQIGGPPIAGDVIADTHLRRCRAPGSGCGPTDVCVRHRVLSFLFLVVVGFCWWAEVAGRGVNGWMDGRVGQ
ncbi:uncharacterized protein J3D65DRAFT_120564 [Phyllosticta citribraziliensis]|uniref:Uncharacterized protein n=1 Tax=Phyllosticta citribraziliensis TaxID=989973 RepID=A0ABR1LD87_9PEZI